MIKHPELIGLLSKLDQIGADARVLIAADAGPQFNAIAKVFQTASELF